VCDKAQQSCPLIQPFALWTHYWPFIDPAAAAGTEEERLEVFRSVRDEIERTLRAWIAAGCPAAKGRVSRDEASHPVSNA
jgi:arsenate reductase